MFYAGKVPKKSLMIFYEQMAALLTANVPMDEALETILLEQENRHIQRMLNKAQGLLANGEPVSTALSSCPEIFPPVVVKMFQEEVAAEKLALLFTGLAKESGDGHVLREKLKMTLIYPAIILTFMLIIGVLILTFVIPVFAEMYSDMHSSLPLLTQFVIYLGERWFLLALGSIVLFMGAKAAAGKWPDWPLYVPFMRKPAKLLSMLSFFRYLQVMLAMELPTASAMQQASALLHQAPLGKKLMDTARQETGQGLAAMLTQDKIFTPLTVQMVRVGERSGQLDTCLQSLAGYLQADAVRSTERLGIAAAIFSWMFTAFLVGGFVLSMYLPIFQLAVVAG